MTIRNEAPSPIIPSRRGPWPLRSLYDYRELLWTEWAKQRKKVERMISSNQWWTERGTRLGTAGLAYGSHEEGGNDWRPLHAPLNTRPPGARRWTPAAEPSGEEGDLTTMERLAHAMIRRKPATGEEMEGRKDRSTPPLATLRLGLYGEVISSLPTDHLLSTSRSRPHSLISLEGRARSVMGRFLLAYGSSEPIVMRWGWEARRMWRVRWLPLPSHAGLRVTHLLRTRHREVKQRQ